MISSDQYVAIRTQDKELIRLPLSLLDRNIRLGIESLNDRGMLKKSHICLIAVPRGSLTNTFTYIYEVVRKNDWSILPLGGSVDSQDISQLSNAYNVDTIVVPVDAIESIFTADFADQFDAVRHLLYVSGVPTQKTLDTIKARFPHLNVAPFIYHSDTVGPVGLPIKGNENAGFTALEGVHLEVESKDGQITDNGSGIILASVLGYTQLTRRSTGYKGNLVIEDSKETVRFDEGFNR